MRIEIVTLPEQYVEQIADLRKQLSDAETRAETAERRLETCVVLADQLLSVALPTNEP